MRSRFEKTGDDCGMGDWRVSLFTRPTWDAQARMDQTGLGSLSNALSANQSGGLLARALAKCRSKLQQPTREFVGRIAAGLPRRHCQSGLAGQSDPARVAEVCAGPALNYFQTARIAPRAAQPTT